MWENSLLNLSFQPEFLTCERGMVDDVVTVRQAVAAN